jgi:lipid-binding SYLF domain-containing protein
MNPRKISTAAFSVLACLVASTVCFAGQKQSKDYRDAVSQSEKASRVFREIMRAPDKAVPRDILDGAECVAVFPQVLKAGFVVGARAVAASPVVERRLAGARLRSSISVAEALACRSARSQPISFCCL